MTLPLTTTDASLIVRVKRYSLIAWFATLVLGLSSWGANFIEFHALASFLFAGAWITGAAFIVCWLFLAVSALVLLFNHFSGRSGGA